MMIAELTHRLHTRPVSHRFTGAGLVLRGVVIATALLLLTTFATAAPVVVWDDFNAHIWTVSLERPEDMQLVERDWIQDGDRSVFHIKYTPEGATSRYLLAFTNLLAPETLEGVSEIRFDLKWDQRPANAAFKLEAKELLHPFRSDAERLIFAKHVAVQPNGYQTYRIPIETVASFSRLLFVFENIQGASSDIYLDNLRFVRQGQEFVWDTFERPAHFWVPFGSWLSWAGPTANPALDLISTFDRFPTGPSGALLLHWDVGPDSREHRQTGSAEIKTEGSSLKAMSGHAPTGLNADLSAFTTMSADVVASNQNTLGVFFGHFIDGTTTIEQGFITPGVRIMTPGTPQRLSWDIPWPPHFPAEDVDIVAFVVRDTDVPGLEKGMLRLDNVTLHTPAFLASEDRHAVWYISHFDFDARDESLAASDRSGVNPKISFLGGNMGEFSPDDAVTPQSVMVRHDPTQSAPTEDRPGASLRLDLDLSHVDFAGQFISLLGHSDYTDAYTLDLTQFSQLQLSLRPGEDNTTPLWLRVEIKDYRDSHDYTAYRYVQIPAAPAPWQHIVLDADITNPAQWRFSRYAPDPTRAKLLILVMERFFNPERFSFNLDELRLIHKTDKPFDLEAALAKPDQRGLDDLLAHVQQKAWLHFDRWVVDGVKTNPDLYLFLDRSSYPDLISTAAVGFGLAAIVVGHRLGWLSEPEATERVLRVLRTYANGPMIDDPSTASAADIDNSIGVKGWFWHFLERDGTRKRKTYSGAPLTPVHKSELSSVDTAIFLWGALAAREYFSAADPDINPSGPSARAAEITALVDRIYRRIDFPFFRRPPDTPPKQGQIYLAWKPERIDPAISGGAFLVPTLDLPDGRAGYYSGMPDRPATWDRYTDELLMILLLGVASPNANYRLPMSIFPLQDYLLNQAPTAVYTAPCEGDAVGPVLHSFFGSGFTYFFLQNFFKADHTLMPILGIDLFRNAQRAARASWLYSRCGAGTNAPTFQGNVFGLTAAEGRYGHYRGEWGAAPNERQMHTDDGTVPIYGHLGFLPLWSDDFHDPKRVMFGNPSMDSLVTLLREGQIFDEAHGFGDAINLVPEPGTGLPFYNMVTFGIDNGPIVMGIENKRSGLFWRLNLLCQEMDAAGIGVHPVELSAHINTTDCLTTMSSFRKRAEHSTK